MSDPISRQAAIDALIEWYGCEPSDLDYFKEIVEKLPSADRPQGEWESKEVLSNADGEVIEEWQSARCSNCGRYHTTPYMYYFNKYNFCPNCGADMRGGDNETD